MHAPSPTAVISVLAWPPVLAGSGTLLGANAPPSDWNAWTNTASVPLAT